ncbi:MAG: integrative and conjugative element protein (TIGR02256 family) [Sulfurimonas sp.]|jgi:integrative and conjugative element protein (TIGR02256 family)
MFKHGQLWNTNMKHYHYNLTKLQVVFENSVIDKMVSKAQFCHNEKERGGLLLGRLFPKENLIVIVEAIESPAISSKSTEIYVDNNIANKDMKQRWKDSGGKITYVGDWHTHPEVMPNPSHIDLNTFKDTYRSSKIDQNLLLCVIIGTNSIEKGGLWVGAQRWFKLYRLCYNVKNKLFCKNTNL